MAAATQPLIGDRIDRQLADIDARVGPDAAGRESDFQGVEAGTALGGSPTSTPLPGCRAAPLSASARNAPPSAAICNAVSGSDAPFVMRMRLSYAVAEAARTRRRSARPKTGSWDHSIRADCGKEGARHRLAAVDAGGTPLNQPLVSPILIRDGPLTVAGADKALVPMDFLFAIGSACPSGVARLRAVRAGHHGLRPRVLHREAHEVTFKESRLYVGALCRDRAGLRGRRLLAVPGQAASFVACSVSSVPGCSTDAQLIAAHAKGPHELAWTATQLYLTGYVVEYTLAMDNVFVISLLFTYFAVRASTTPRAVLGHYRRHCPARRS